MFVQTYGLLYERNSYIFTDLFDDLERYYNYGQLDLKQVFDSFFHRLYQKMFQVLNAQYTFDEIYLQCITKHMEDLKPFGDVPKKLTQEVRRSFIATRTFHQSLVKARHVVEKLLEVRPSVCLDFLVYLLYRILP